VARGVTGLFAICKSFEKFELSLRERLELSSAAVRLANRFAAQREDDSVFIRNLEKLLKEVPGDIGLGLYECPYPLQACPVSRAYSFFPCP